MSTPMSSISRMFSRESLSFTIPRPRPFRMHANVRAKDANEFDSTSCPSLSSSLSESSFVTARTTCINDDELAFLTTCPTSIRPNRGKGTKTIACGQSTTDKQELRPHSDFDTGDVLSAYELQTVIDYYPFSVTLTVRSQLFSTENYTMLRAGDTSGTCVMLKVYVTDDYSKQMVSKQLEMQALFTKRRRERCSHIGHHESNAHTRVLKLYASFIHETHTVLVFEHTTGKTLYHLIYHARQRRRLDPHNKNVKFKFRKKDEYEGFCNNEEDQMLIMKLVFQIAQALFIFHEAGAIHGAVAPENIFLDENGDIKLAHCEHAKMTEERKIYYFPQYRSSKLFTRFKKSSSSSTIDDFIISPSNRIPPEMRTVSARFRRRTVGEEYDTWGLGLILYELLYRRLPSLSFFTRLTARKINRQGSGGMNLPKKPIVSAEIQDLLLKMLNPNEKERIVIEDVLGHPFVRRFHRVCKTVRFQ